MTGQEWLTLTVHQKRDAVDGSGALSDIWGRWERFQVVSPWKRKSRRMDRPLTHELQVCLCGAAPDTGNLGVSALCYATLAGVLRRAPGAHVTVFDEGWGVRTDRLLTGEAAESGKAWGTYSRCGARYSRRYHRPESLWNMRVCGWFGGLNNPGAQALHQADAVLDITGGDSFTDMYGAGRFNAVTAMKKLVLGMGIPLILLPQTYGPFQTDRARRTATEILRQVTRAWARDERSYAYLQELLGKDFDPQRHRCGMDVAFELAACEPRAELPSQVRHWLRDRPGPVVGINVSGLLFLDPEGSRKRYGLKADYQAAIKALIHRLLQQTSCRILLIPHVVEPCFSYESDAMACSAIAAEMGREGQHRLAILPAFYGPGEVKWVIGQLDWFCGTRMHSAIAALSQGVATAGISYSIKTAGVFEACGQGKHVADPRVQSTPDVVERVWQAWEERAASAARLRKALPGVLAKAREQMDEIVADCAALRLGRRGNVA